MAQALTEEEEKYVQENQKTLQIAVDNCFLLFDPKQQQKAEEMFKCIECKPADRLYIYLFIVNTCEVVEGLEPAHIVAVCQLYKQMSDEQLQYFSKLIQDAFFAPVDVKTSGALQFIWTQLIESCMTKIATARGQSLEGEESLPVEKLENVTADEGIIQHSEPEVVVGVEPIEP